MLKKAIVHEWFSSYMGSERCVESFVNIYPEADVYSLIDFLKDEDREIILQGKKAKTSFIQKLPFSKTKYRNYLPLFPYAIEQFDLSDRDIIISSSHAVAKGVLTNAKQLHICYCHTPIRYAWDLYFQYLNESKLNGGIKSVFAKYFLHKIRLWDIATVNRVDHYIANSKFIANRIKKIYNRDSRVIYPPVDIDKFNLETQKSNYYLAVARFVPYKKVDLIVKTFSEMPDKKLVVVGSGPDEKKIKNLAAANIEFVGHQKPESLSKYMQQAKAFVFAAEEDFGITNVEALACGTPVIAYGIGGSAETIRNDINGILFFEQTVSSLKEAILKFEKTEDKFDPVNISESAKGFSRKNYESNIKRFVEQKWMEFIS